MHTALGIKQVIMNELPHFSKKIRIVVLVLAAAYLFSAFYTIDFLVPRYLLVHCADAEVHKPDGRHGANTASMQRWHATSRKLFALDLTWFLNRYIPKPQVPFITLLQPIPCWPHHVFVPRTGPNRGPPFILFT